MKPEVLYVASQAIDDAIRRHLDEVPFVKIAVTPDTDEYGEEFLWVKAVYAGQPEDIDTHKSVTVINFVRSRLERVAVEAFPVISYIAKSDLSERELESL